MSFRLYGAESRRRVSGGEGTKQQEVTAEGYEVPFGGGQGHFLMARELSQPLAVVESWWNVPGCEWHDLISILGVSLQSVLQVHYRS